jgi:uncharacterized phiE125 gp8 family phage protein
MGLNKTVAAATDAITTAEAKTHMRIDAADDDTYIAALIAAATNYAETYTGRQFVTATYQLCRDCFINNGMFLGRSPAASVTSITYYDSSNEQQTLSTDVYELDSTVSPGRVVLKYSEDFPSITSRHNGIVITYTAGYGDADSVPEGIKAALKFMVAHWYENREPVVLGTIATELPFGVKSLLDIYKVHERYLYQ